MTRRWCLPLAVLVLIAGALAVPAYGAAVKAASVPPVTQISSDPFANSTSQHATEVEPDSFTWGNTIVDTIQAGRFVTAGSSDIGWATSTDGGATWTHGFVSGLTVHRGGGTYPRTTNAVVTYDARHHTWLIAATAIMWVAGRAEPPGIGVAVVRSANGMAWTRPVFAIGGTSFTPNYDKDWITCDDTPSSPHYGICYAMVDMHADSNQMAFATSTDGGATWSKPVDPAGATGGLIGGMAVQPDGTVVAVYNTVEGADRQVALTSSDGGKTWSAPVAISGVRHHQPDGNLRGHPLPSVTADKAGKIYVVWADCRFRTGCPENDIVFSTSTNAVTWTAPARIPIDPVASHIEHYLPVIVASPATSGAAAHLALYYNFYPKANCTRATCMIGEGFSSSVNGGATWSAGRHLVTPFALTRLPFTSRGRMVGDYIGATVTASGIALGALIIARKPATGEAYNVGLYTDGGQAITGGPSPAQTDPGQP
ncbi:MAG TPA: sialidase family protein [Streptosporangiaceae bacterium]